MRDYPKLNPAELTVTANTDLGLFLRHKLGSNAMHPIEEAIGYTNKDNGHLILQFLLNHYGRATDGERQVLLQVQYLCEEHFAFGDYKEIYQLHPEAAIAFFRRPDLIDYYPNGVIGTEVDHGPPCTIFGPLSPLLEEEVNNNNTNIGGDKVTTHYENGGGSPSNQVSSEDEEAITNIGSLRTFNMKRHLPTDTDEEDDSLTTAADDYEHETLPAALHIRCFANGRQRTATTTTQKQKKKNSYDTLHL
jgi:hypothetical protein